jgi:hypothetical protein
VTIQETAARLHRWAAIEASTFQVLGGWVPSTPRADVKLVLAEQARHHGWHAQLWHERIPSISSTTGAGEDAGGVREFFASVAALNSVEGRLTAAYLVLGRAMVAEYRAALTSLSPVADGPTIRGLLLVLADAERDVAAGEGLVREVGADEQVRATLEPLWPAPAPG